MKSRSSSSSSSSRHLLKLVLACLGGFAFIDMANAVPSSTTTTTMPPPPDELVTSTRETTNVPKVLPENRTLPAKDIDSRHAYVDNQYIADEDMDDDDDIERNQPLYDLIQQQMEHVLTAPGSGISNFDITSNNADDNPNNDIKRDGIQGLPNRLVYDNMNEHQSDLYDYSEDDVNDGNDQSSDDVKQQLEEDIEGGYYVPTQRITTPSTTTTSTTTTTTYRPKTTRRRHIGIRTTKSPYRTTSTEPTTTTQWTTWTTQKPKTHRPTNTLCSNANGYYNNHERRLVFKTISTGSQFVHSPIGDLIIKFTIGYAKPPPVMFLPRSSAPVVNDALKTLSSNLLKQLNLNAYQASLKKVKRVKKSPNPDDIE